MQDKTEHSEQFKPTINYLFKAMFEAEEVEEHDLARQFKNTIKQALLGDMITREQFLVEFVNLLCPKDHTPKKVWNFYQEMRSKSFSQLKLAIHLSSFMSWSLQAVEKISPMAYIYLQVPRQAEMLSELMNGNLSQAQLLDFYVEVLGTSPVPTDGSS